MLVFFVVQLLLHQQTHTYIYTSTNIQTHIKYYIIQLIYIYVYEFVSKYIPIHTSLAIYSTTIYIKLFIVLITTQQSYFYYPTKQIQLLLLLCQVSSYVRTLLVYIVCIISIMKNLLNFKWSYKMTMNKNVNF